MRVVDLFCGCGGLSLGLIHAGFNVVAGYDYWPIALETYRNNFAHPAIEINLADVQNCTKSIAAHDPDMLAGGPPCQDFSSAGKRDEQLGRADLTRAFIEIVADIRPAWVLIENVERAAASKTFAMARARLCKLGYGLTQTVLEASRCGVPQQRKRLFLLGQLGGVHNALLPYLKRSLSPTPMTVRQYLGDTLGLEYYYRHPRSYKRRAIFSIDEPSPTIRGVNRPIPKGYPGHPGDPVPLTDALRPLTTKERSLIQTFPPNFVFVGSQSAVEQMIGNAVPVKLAEYVGRCLTEFLADAAAGKTNSTAVRQLLLF